MSMTDIHKNIQLPSIGKTDRAGHPAAMSTTTLAAVSGDPNAAAPYDPALYHATERVPIRHRWCEITDALVAE